MAGSHEADGGNRSDRGNQGNAPAECESTALKLDLLYHEVDRLYHVYARGCGLSDCAYWMLYDLEVAGGALPLRNLTESWSYSKQTINSALKVLQTRGLVALDFEAGSRKSKVASLTDEGRAFSGRHIVPAIRAEDRAFATLAPAERAELIRLVGHYVDALDAGMAAVLRSQADSDAEDGA